MAHSVILHLSCGTLFWAILHCQFECGTPHFEEYKLIVLIKVLPLLSHTLYAAVCHLLPLPQWERRTVLPQSRPLPTPQ